MDERALRLDIYHHGDLTVGVCLFTLKPTYNDFKGIKFLSFNF